MTDIFPSPPVIDPTGRLIICASTGRPTGAAGKWIYEYDTEATLVHDGTGWIRMAEPGQDWASTMSGGSLGTGRFVGSYHREDGFVDFEGVFEVDSGQTWGPWTAPVTLDAATATAAEGVWAYAWDDSASASYPLMVRLSSTTIALSAVALTGSYPVASAVSSTQPFTWAAGDRVHLGGRARMDTRYL